jgi:hypothetical protein
MKSKKGSHVGMVLSFVVFVVFVIFLYDILAPAISRDESKQAALDNLKAKLDEALSLDSIIISLKINESHIFNEDCFELEEGNITSLYSDKNFAVKDDAGQLFGYLIDGKKLRIALNGTQNKFFRIYISDNFNNAFSTITGSCDDVEENHTIGNIRIEKHFSENEIKNLITLYEADYEKIKKDFDLPLDIEFGLMFNDSRGVEIKTTKSVPGSVNIYVEEVPIQYLDTEANLKPGKLKITVW